VCYSPKNLEKVLANMHQEFAEIKYIYILFIKTTFEE
jgi:hypothetical protein